MKLNVTNKVEIVISIDNHIFRDCFRPQSRSKRLKMQLNRREGTYFLAKYV